MSINNSWQSQSFSREGETPQERGQFFRGFAPKKGDN